MPVNRTVDVVSAVQSRPQYWLVTLECGHRQDVHSTRDGGPRYVRQCETCERQEARR